MEYVKFIKEKYGIEYALKKGVDANKLVSNLNPKYIAFYLDAILEHGTDIDAACGQLRSNTMKRDRQKAVAEASGKSEGK